MFRTILNALGHAIVAVVSGLWNAIVMPILHGVGHGTGTLMRIVAPWVIGGGVLYAFWCFNPAAAEALLQAILVLAIVVFGLRIMFRRPGGQQNRRR